MSFDVNINTSSIFSRYLFVWKEPASYILCHRYPPCCSRCRWGSWWTASISWSDSWVCQPPGSQTPPPWAPDWSESRAWGCHPLGHPLWRSWQHQTPRCIASLRCSWLSPELCQQLENEWELLYKTGQVQNKMTHKSLTQYHFSYIGSKVFNVLSQARSWMYWWSN